VEGVAEVSGQGQAAGHRAAPLRGRRPAAAQHEREVRRDVFRYPPQLPARHTDPDQMRSRVAGAHSSINYGIRPLGALTGGLLGSWIGVRETLLVSATGGACAILWLINSPIIRLHDLNTLESPRNKPAPQPEPPLAPPPLLPVSREDPVR